MRLIGTLPDTAQARRFVAYLHTVGIESSEEAAAAGRQIWVRDEDAVERARSEMERFREDPAGSKYLAAEKQSRELAKSEQTEKAKRRDRVVTGKDIWTSVGGPPSRRLTVTWALIGASVVCTVLIGANNPDSTNWAWQWGQFWSEGDVARYQATALLEGEPAENVPLSLIFGEISKGQIWRLVTPIFFHFSITHILFNMLWLYQLGGQIEDRVRAWRYVALVLFFAVAGNLAQALSPSSLNEGIGFGGMSGVVYGCFGYVWLKTILEPRAGYRLSMLAVFLIIGWHILTSMPGNGQLFGGSVANVGTWAHGGGLAAGALAAVASYLYKKSRAA
ncbi:MAG TPA: rhomboid family intramembrane serine protease [Pirellulaceae bacterium]|jgi:GlpG protein|nr:rhomboid family intramembrane serine protease [Pirellulaceae bacterium]